MTSDASTVRFGRMAPMVPVSDIGKAVDFYCSVFGFAKTFENGSPVVPQFMRNTCSAAIASPNVNSRPSAGSLL